MKHNSSFKNASNFGATFTQLLRNEKPFGHQDCKFSYHFSKYTFFAELFTNVKLRANDIPAFVRGLSDTFRKVINSDVRYRQRMNDLPCAVGCRAFGVVPLGGGWYSPNIKVATNNAQVLEFICRQWCKRTAQYPHTLDISFNSPSDARKALPKFADRADYAKTSNINCTRHGSIVREEYYISQPFRIEYYISRCGFLSATFGSACRILRCDLCHFDNLNNLAVNLNDRSYIINDFFAVNGLRAVQSWGFLSELKNKPVEVDKGPNIKHTRHFYGGNTDKMASLYYRACRAGFLTFNAYIYGRMKAGNNFRVPIERSEHRQFERLTAEENAIMSKPDYCAHPEELKKWNEQRIKRQKCKPKALRLPKM